MYEEYEVCIVNKTNGEDAPVHRVVRAHSISEAIIMFVDMIKTTDDRLYLIDKNYTIKAEIKYIIK